MQKKDILEVKEILKSTTVPLIEEKISFKAYDLLREYPHTTFTDVGINKYGKKYPLGMKSNHLKLSEGELIKYQNKEDNWMQIQLMRTEDLYVIDIDEKSRKLERLIPDLDKTVRFETNRGYHYYIRIPNFPSDKMISNELKILRKGLPCGDLLHFTKVVWEKKDRVSESSLIIDVDWNLLYNNIIWMDRLIDKKIIKEDSYDEYTEIDENIHRDADYEKTRKLLLGLNVSRSEDFESWKRCCIILKRTFDEETAFDLFNIFSKRGSNYSGYNKLIEEFNKFDETRYNINYGTLVYWLRDDNSKIYRELFSKEMQNINYEYKTKEEIEEILENYNIDWERLTHKTYGLRVKYLYEDKFLYTGGVLYYWNNYYWCEENANIYLGKAVGSLYEYYMKAHDYYKRVATIQESTIALKNIKQLDNIKYKDSIGKQCLEEYFVDKIEWNNNNNIIQFENCCYDLESEKFIECNPKNYINHSIGYNYVKGERKYMDELEKIIKSTQADESNYRELMKFLSSCLNRFNKEEIVDFWTNTGRNGKGLLKDICLLVFGNYAGDLPSSHFTQEDKNANGGKTHLYKNKNSRIVFVNELNEGECLLEEPFKKWSGNDLIVCRDNFSKAKDIVSYKGGKLVFLTNNLPNFKNNKMDVGLRQRIIVRKFPYTFCDENEYDSNNPNLKLRDNELKNKLSNEEYRNAMMELLLRYYKLYKKEGFKKTDLMKKETENYFNDVDVVGRFIKDNITYAEGKRVKVKDLYDRFRMLNNTPLTIQIFTKRITEKNIYEIKNIRNMNFIVNYVLKEIDESEPESDN